MEYAPLAVKLQLLAEMGNRAILETERIGCKSKEVEMKTQRTLIATCIAALFASSAVMAKDKWEYNEDKWDDTRSYGSVNIDKDSVQQWGPWEQFVEPAAGAPNIAAPNIAFLGAGSGDKYRPLPVPVVPVNPPIISSGCEDGMACGYAVFRNYEGYGGYYNGDGGEHPATFAVRIPSTVGEGATTAWHLTSLDGTSPAFPASGELGNPYISGNYFQFSRYDYVDGGEGGASISGYVSENIPVATGWFSRYIYGYGCDGECSYRSDSGTSGPYVAGIVTSATDMAELRANTIGATFYSGSAYQGSPVEINVTFAGAGSWEGRWNDGADGSTWTYTPSGTSQQYIRGQVGFIASGTVTGSNIQSTNVSATDGTVSGMVKGSFFGSQAAALGGVVDITKTKPDGYSNARHVDVFLTTKDVPR